MKWKVTRDGKDIYPGNTGISKKNALRQAKLGNRWATMNHGKPTYGIRPIEEEGILVIEFTPEDLDGVEYKPQEEQDKYGPDGVWIGCGWMNVEDVRR